MDRVPADDGGKRGGLREFTQLLRIQERLSAMLQEVLNELGAPTTLTLLRELRNRTGSSAGDTFGRITSSVEGALRELKVFESEVGKKVLDAPEDETLEGMPDLPAPLARFLAEKAQSPNFTFQVTEDPVRGWIISWKEYTEEGMIRGFGQIYERPYAWLEE